MRAFVIHEGAEETYMHDIVFAQVFLREWLERVVCDEVYIFCTPDLRQVLAWRYVEAIDPGWSNSLLASSSGHILHL